MFSFSPSFSILLCLSCLWNTHPIITSAFPSSSSPSSFTSRHHSSSSSRWCAEYTARIQGISDRQSVPELVPRRRSLSFSGWSSDALCLPLTLTHNTCACCVVVCYISVVSRFRPLSFPAPVHFSETTCFYKTVVNFFKLYCILFYSIILLFYLLSNYILNYFNHFYFISIALVYIICNFIIIKHCD